MSYNYSLSYLNKHGADVNRLISAYQTGQILQLNARDHNELVQMRTYIRGLLAALAAHYPARREMKQRMRTWSKMMPDGSWSMFVGVPGDKLPGSQPLPGTRDLMSDEAYEKITLAARSTSWKYPVEISNGREMLGFMNTLIQSKDKDHVEAVSYMPIDSEPGATFKAGAEGIGWQMQQEEITGGRYKITAKRGAITEAPQESKPQESSPDMGTPVSHEDFLKALDQYVDKAKRGGL